MTSIHNYLKKERIFLLSLVLALFSLVSCQKEPVITFGSTYTSDNSSANIVVVDTTSIVVSTVYVDSTNTAATGYLMVGNLQDPYFGNINANAYLQVTPPGNIPAPASMIYDTYDSIALVMLFKKGNPYYGDTTASQTIQVQQVSQLYQLASFQHGFFSNYTLGLNPNILGSVSTTIAPNIPYVRQGYGDSLKIRLSDSLGLALWNMMKGNSDTIFKPAIWLNWFNGLNISAVPNNPGSSPGVIYGFRDSAIMRVFYHPAAAFVTEAFIDFGITNKSFQFNSVVKNWAGSPLQRLDTPTYNPQSPPATQSDTTANAGYVQGPTGLSVKLNFPYLNSIALRPDYLSVLRAELIVKPVPGSWGTTWRLPPQLEAYYTDYHNLIGSPITGGNNGIGGAQTGNLIQDYVTPTNTTYTYDVTNFVKAQITNTGLTSAQNGIMLSIPPPAYTGAFNRLVIADQTYPVNERITLSVYYISLYPHQ